jgi:thiamine biosynthesis lipoprotein
MFCGFIALLIMVGGCRFKGEVEEFSGNVWGTTYHVTYVSSGTTVSQDAVDDLLSGINQSLSIYIDTSVIARVNDSSDTSMWFPVDEHFAKVFRRSREVYADTGGAFNPAVGPLVNAWGFGPEGPTALPSDDEIRALRELASFDKFEFRESPPAVRKPAPAARLDFNAIAEGYAVDTIGGLLESRGVMNYVAELGGEVRARGRKPDGSSWRVGIEKPSIESRGARQIETAIELRDAGLATSGNYRKRRVQDGKTAAHIIDPKTGYPALTPLLSVSVVAPDAMTADAYATAFIVWGLDESMRFLESHKQLQAYFITQDSGGNLVETRSSGFPTSVGK